MRVFNVKDADIPASAVYVGRRTKWGNPFVIGRDGDRDEVIRRFAALLQHDATLRAAVKRELKGRDLCCHCKPLPCHADLLLILANEDGI